MKYEYKVLSTKELLDTQILQDEGKLQLSYKSSKAARSLINKHLNTLGYDGWELIAVRSRNVFGSWNSDDYFLKKQKDS